MALYLRAPRKSKTPNFEIRGTHLRVRVEQSSGTPQRSLAMRELHKIERAIEAGAYPAPAPVARPDEPTFLSAALAYMEAGGSRRYVAGLIRHFGETPLPEIDQAAIDAAASELHPHVTAGTRNCYVYTPVSAILHHALGDKAPIVRRPKGAKGKVKTDFMWPDDAFAIIRAADTIDAEFGLYLRLLIYTGIRKGEGLGLLSENIQVAERAAWISKSKNDDPRMLRLREDILAPLEAHLAAGTRARLFRFHDGGHFKHFLLRAKLAVCGLPCPKRRPTGWRPPKYRLAFVTFHTFRHTWATWMRRYAGMDLQGLTATKNWKDPRSAARYAHVVAREEWDRVEKLPGVTGNARGKAAS